MFCDSFTSQWQDRVYKTYRVDQYQMMFGVNFFSLLFTSMNLLWTGEMGLSLAFLAANPAALANVLTLSLTSATGQLFIFYTISKYGPLVFATIQTVRQFLSGVLSIVFFAHPLNSMEAVGIAIRVVDGLLLVHAVGRILSIVDCGNFAAVSVAL